MILRKLGPASGEDFHSRDRDNISVTVETKPSIRFSLRWPPPGITAADIVVPKKEEIPEFARILASLFSVAGFPEKRDANTRVSWE